MFLAITLLIIGLVLLVYGADRLVYGAAVLSRSLGSPSHYQDDHRRYWYIATGTHCFSYSGIEWPNGYGGG